MMDMNGSSSTMAGSCFTNTNRPTSLSFGMPSSSMSSMLSPSPMSFGVSPMSIMSTPKTPVTFMSVMGTPITPGLKRKADESELFQFHAETEFGPAPPKMFTIDHVAADKVLSNGYFKDDDYDDWSPCSPPMDPSDDMMMTDFEMRSMLNHQTHNKELPGGILKAKRRMTPGTSAEECWEQQENCECWDTNQQANLDVWNTDCNANPIVDSLNSSANSNGF